jgi:hypothetical protein
VNAPHGRARERLHLDRATRATLVESTIETQAALDQAAFLIANTTPHIDSLLDCHLLQRRLEAELHHAITTARTEAADTAGTLDRLEATR